MEIRRRNVSEESEKPIVSHIERFDVFVKLPNEYKEKSLSGATISILTFILIFFLIVIELWTYFQSPLIFSYSVDKDPDSKLRINVDMTVAMPCRLIGADVMDQTGSTVSVESSLIEEDVNFELSDVGKIIYQQMAALNNRNHQDFASLKQVVWNNNYQSRIWKSDHSTLHKPLQEAVKGACRIHGSVFVRKMPGNFHVTAGKHVELGFIGAHAHLSGFMEQSDYNFSHRIHHLSFGDPSINILNPMDAEESVVNSNYHLFQYFVEVVPTEMKTFRSNIHTYQYAVREQNRSVDHNKGSHGQPGIFVRYDISPLVVTINEASKYGGIIGFLVHLSAVIGGVFATIGLLLQLFNAGPLDWACKHWKTGKYGALPLDVAPIKY